VSRDELLQAMDSAVDLAPVYVATLVLSAVVAAVGSFAMTWPSSSVPW
jgi:hypothetical protein